MLRTMTHVIKDMRIEMTREEDLCSLEVSREGKNLIDVNMISSADMRKITRVLADSPFIFSDGNK